MTKREALTPPAIVERLLHAAGPDVVLVGGQALAVWVQRYDLAIPEGVAAYLDISADEYLNVDVIFDVLGISAEAVLARSVTVASEDAGTFLVMHPLHVLHSRLINLYKLADKQNEKGCMQLAMAIDVARAFLREAAASSSAADLASGRSVIQTHVTEIERMAIEDAGRKVATRHGLHVADAIDPSLVPAGAFWTKRWPGLRKLMSATYAAGFADHVPSGLA